MGPGRRTLRDTSRVLRCCFCLPGRSSVVKQMPLCYNTGTTLTNNRRSCVRVTLPAPKKAREPIGSRASFFLFKIPHSALPLLVPKEGGVLFRVRNSKSCLSHVFCSSCAIRMGVIYWFLDKSNGLSGETEKKRRCFGKV